MSFDVKAAKENCGLSDKPPLTTQDSIAAVLNTLWYAISEIEELRIENKRLKKKLVDQSVSQGWSYPQKTTI